MTNLAIGGNFEPYCIIITFCGLVFVCLVNIYIVSAHIAPTTMVGKAFYIVYELILCYGYICSFSILIKAMTSATTTSGAWPGSRRQGAAMATVKFHRYVRCL